MKPSLVPFYRMYNTTSYPLLLCISFDVERIPLLILSRDDLVRMIDSPLTDLIPEGNNPSPYISQIKKESYFCILQTHKPLNYQSPLILQ